MKKRLILMTLALIFLLVLSACGCKHEIWKDATCEFPKTCAECAETEGAALGHTWMAATCETPKTCETCAVTEGEAKGHAWAEATCLTAKTCSNCGLTEGEALGHVWEEATTEAPKTCSSCGLTEGERIVTDPRFTTAATREVQGVWGLDIEADREMLQMEDLDGFMGVMKCRLVMSFGGDGSVEMHMQILNEQEFMDDLTTYMIEQIYTEMAASGVSRETADELIKSVYGMGVEEYVKQALSMVDFNSLLGSFSYNGVYYVEDSQIFLGLSWDQEMEPAKYSVEGDTLTLEEDITESGEARTVLKRLPQE